VEAAEATLDETVTTLRPVAALGEMVTALGTFEQGGPTHRRKHTSGNVSWCESAFFN
jgi:hypothetical protein